MFEVILLILLALWLMVCGISVASPWYPGTKYVVTTSDMDNICTNVSVENADGTLNMENLKVCLKKYISSMEMSGNKTAQVRESLEQYKRNGLVIVVLGWLLFATGVGLLLYLILKSIFAHGKLEIPHPITSPLVVPSAPIPIPSPNNLG